MMRCVLLSLVLLLALPPSTANAGPIGATGSYVQRMFMKLGVGVVNVVASPLEPLINGVRTSYEYDENGSSPWAGLGIGLVGGCGLFTARLELGLQDVVTFFIAPPVERPLALSVLDMHPAETYYGL